MSAAEWEAKCLVIGGGNLQRGAWRLTLMEGRAALAIESAKPTVVWLAVSGRRGRRVMQHLTERRHRCVTRRHPDHLGANFGAERAGGSGGSVRRRQLRICKRGR